MEADEHRAALPLDLIEPIANLLLAHDVVDYISFRAVCHDWRSHTAPPAGLASKFRPRNWIMLPYFGNDNPSTTAGTFLNLSTGRSLVLNLPELQSYAIMSSCDGLLVLIDKETLIMRIFNPFTRYMSGDLPRLDPEFGFTVDYIPSGYEQVRRYSCITIEDNDSSCPVLMLCVLSASVFFARPKDTRWNYMECDYKNATTNTFFQGKFYYINMGNEICAIDPEQRLKTSLVPLHYDAGDAPSVLVKFDSDLILVRSIGEPLIEHFEIFRVDLNSNTLIELHSLGEHALISGVNRQTIIIPSKSFPSIKANSIYFFLLPRSRGISTYYTAMPSHAQTATYSVTDQSIELLSNFHDADSIQPRTLVDYLLKYYSSPRW